MTPDESVAELAKLADAAGAVIGDGWKLLSGTLTPEEEQYPNAGECKLPNGKDGGNYGLSWNGPGVADPDKAITEIDKAWQKLGVKATLTSKSEDPYPNDGHSRVLSDPPFLTGTYPDGYGIELSVGANYSTLVATTHCIPIPAYAQENGTNSSDISSSKSGYGDVTPVSEVAENSASVEKSTSAVDVEFLPVGSVVEVKDEDGLFVVGARAIKRDESGEIVDQYKVGLYPKGDASDSKVTVVDRAQISKVVFEGYSDPKAEKTFLAGLVGLMESAENAAKAVKPDKVLQPASEVRVSAADARLLASGVAKLPGSQTASQTDPLAKFKAKYGGSKAKQAKQFDTESDQAATWDDMFSGLTSPDNNPARDNA